MRNPVAPAQPIRHVGIYRDGKLIIHTLSESSAGAETRVAQPSGHWPSPFPTHPLPSKFAAPAIIGRASGPVTPPDLPTRALEYALGQRPSVELLQEWRHAWWGTSVIALPKPSAAEVSWPLPPHRLTRLAHLIETTEPRDDGPLHQALDLLRFMFAPPSGWEMDDLLHQISAMVGGFGPKDVQARRGLNELAATDHRQRSSAAILMEDLYPPALWEARAVLHDHHDAAQWRVPELQARLRHQALRVVRQRLRHEALPLQSPDLPQPPLLPTVEQRAHVSELALQLKKLASTPLQERILMLHLQGYTQQEIAEEEQCSRSTVDTHLRRLKTAWKKSS